MVCLAVFVLIGRVQGQVNDVMDVMRGNIDKMMQRGERLDNLEEKSGIRLKCVHSSTFVWQNAALVEVHCITQLMKPSSLHPTGFRTLGYFP